MPRKVRVAFHAPGGEVAVGNTKDAGDVDEEGRAGACCFAAVGRVGDVRADRVKDIARIRG